MTTSTEAQQIKPATIEVPSFTNPFVSYFVNLVKGTCTCPANTYRKVKCKHIRVAQFSVWLKISVHHVMANIKRGEVLFNCTYGACCSYCASGSDHHPSRESKLNLEAELFFQQAI